MSGTEWFVVIVLLMNIFCIAGQYVALKNRDAEIRRLKEELNRVRVPKP